MNWRMYPKSFARFWQSWCTCSWMTRCFLCCTRRKGTRRRCLPRRSFLEGRDSVDGRILSRGWGCGINEGGRLILASLVKSLLTVIFLGSKNVCYHCLLKLLVAFVAFSVCFPRSSVSSPVSLEGSKCFLSSCQQWNISLTDKAEKHRKIVLNSNTRIVT